MTPYDEGFRAGLRGSDQNTCPYKSESEEYDDWFSGWEDGMTERYRDDEDDDDF